jgi:hypothetical protein
VYNNIVITNSKNNKTSSVSITPSGFFGDGKENIIELENFMTERELSVLQDFARSLDTWDETETHYDDEGNVIYEASYWKDRVATETTLLKVNKEIPNIISGMMSRLKPVVENHFKVKIRATSPTVVRWLPGQLQLPHADKELHEGENAGKPNDFPYYDLASLFYLNDDYDGGELYFPNQGIKFKPKAGAAYFFPGDMNYIHGVTEIKKGIRYTCPFFWTITSHVKEENVSS